MQAIRGFGALFICLAPLCAQAQEPGDTLAGQRYAQAYCTQCHALGEAPSPHLDAPSFFALANTPGITGRAIAAALQTSHTTMPNLVVEPRDRDNVVAYITSLRQESP
ncbi:MAG: c-type cytochrome [Bacteroidota bacterium]